MLGKSIKSGKDKAPSSRANVKDPGREKDTKYKEIKFMNQEMYDLREES